VLEVRDSRYTDRFGGERVEAGDVLDIDPRNVEATIVGDLGEPGSLPAGAFDCFILVQTLQYVADPAVALRNALDCIRDGGVLLLSVPTISKIDPALAAVDRWRLTKAGVEALLETTAEPGSFSVTACGNVLVATAFLMGLAAEELTQSELDRVDPAFDLIVFARVQKHAP
jgi:SAM-dependent methyltransferase